MIDLLPPFHAPPRVISPVLHREIHCANASGRQDDSRRLGAHYYESLQWRVRTGRGVEVLTHTTLLSSPILHHRNCTHRTINGILLLPRAVSSRPGRAQNPSVSSAAPCDSAEPAQDHTLPATTLSPSAAFGRRALVANALDFTWTTPPCDCSRRQPRISSPHLRLPSLEYAISSRSLG